MQLGLSSLLSPYSMGIKKTLVELLKEGYVPNHLAIETIANTIRDKRDFQEIAKLILSIYEAGFQRAIKEHEKILKKSGLKVKIVTKEGKTNKIFNQ